MVLTDPLPQQKTKQSKESRMTDSLLFDYPQDELNLLFGEWVLHLPHRTKHPQASDRSLKLKK